jgi:signal transduction histidine kinase
MLRPFAFSSRNIAILYVVASTVLLAVFATPLWYVWNNTIEKGRVDILQADVKAMTNLYLRKGADQLAAVIDARVGSDLHASRQILLLADSSMTKLAGNLSAWPPEISRQPAVQNGLIQIGSRQVRVSVLYQPLPGGYHLLVGRDVARFERLEILFLYGLVGSGAMVCLIAVFGGLLIRRAILSKVHNISRTTSAIVNGDLSRRLVTIDSGYELDMLAETVNRMLDQIEQLIHSVRNVSNAIAHDLRTPLAEIRSHLEELLITRPPPDDAFAQIDATLCDVDRIIAIFNALLRLAEIDSGTRRSGFVPVNVTKVASEVADFYQPVAELKTAVLTFDSEGDVLAPGDPLLLAQAVSNLIDNALKYVRENGAINVQVKRRTDQNIEVVVADDGPGIPESERLKVIERFYRSDASRGTPGVGLGLSLVEGVARLHGGTLELGDNRPGLRATMVLAAHCA